MLETLSNTHIPAPDSAPHKAKPRKTLYMIENERMGGKVPAWRVPKTAKEHIENTLTTAEHIHNPSFENTLAYTGTHLHAGNVNQEEFGFGDLVDMVNPLHHIPVVGHIYREISGDEIKPISNIIGGAVFGGAAGAATGLVNTIVEEETGKDIAGNAMNLAFNGEAPSYKSTSNAQRPQERLDDAITRSKEDLPGNLLTFTDLSAGHDKGFVTERVTNIGDRVLPPREPITQVKLTGLYAL